MAEAESLSPLQTWLKHVDEQLTTQAVNHLKLGLYSEFASHYTEVRDIQEPSVLYHFLLERCLKNNQPKAFKVFLHVLRGLGGTLKGRLLVGEAFGVNSPFQIEDPGVLDLSRMSVNFKFFQCLLKISTHARKVALGEQLMKRFCKERFLNRNCRHVKGLPELFISLHQAQFISADFTHHLVEALSKYKSWICLQHLNDYHKGVGLRIVVFTDAHPGVFHSSSSLDAANATRDLSAAEWTADAKSRHPSKDLDYITAFNDVPNGNGMGNRSFSISRTASRPDDRTGYDVIECSDVDHLIPREYGIQGRYSSSPDTRSLTGLKSDRKKGYKFIVAVSVAVALFAVVLAAILLGTVWIHLVQLPLSSSLPIRQGTTIILGDFNSFYYEQVYIGIDEGHFPNATGDVDYSIDMYGIQTACVDIHVHGIYDRSVFAVITEKNISDFIPIYALSGSYFDFVLSGKVSDLSSSQNKSVDVCINTGSTYEDGHKIECAKKSLFEGFGRYEVSRPGYYFFTVDSVGGTVEYSLNISGNAKKIQASTSELLGCGLNKSNSVCHISLPARSNKYCLLAEFYRHPYNYLKAELDVKVEKSRKLFILGITLTPLVVMVILLLLLSCCVRVVCVKCFCKYRKNQPLHTLTSSI